MQLRRQAQLRQLQPQNKENSMSRLQIWISTLILLGLALVGGAYFLGQSENSIEKNVLAKIEYESGLVSILKSGLGQKVSLKKSAPMGLNQSIETGADGFAVLIFDSAYRVRVIENSLVTMAIENETPLIVVKRGDVQIVNHGRPGSLIISKNGKRIPAENFEMPTDNDSAPVAASEPAAVAKNNETPVTSLTQDYVQNVLRTNKTNFYKCYTQLLQKTPGVSGQTNLSFTIENSGKVRNPGIVASNIQDSNFKACLLDALSRLEFKSFNGEVITTTFPLKFE